MRGFAADAKAKRWDAACEHFGTTARKQLVAAGALLGGSDCGEILEKAPT